MTDRAERLSRLRRYLLAEVDGASLALFRIAFGSILFWEVVRYFVHDRIHRFYIQPSFFFGYLPFVQPWPGHGMYWHFALLGLLAALVAAGLVYRVAAPLLCAAVTYVFLLDKTEYLNHLYLVCLLAFLLALFPAHRVWSLDRLRAARPPPETVPRYILLVLRAQIALVYFYGGVAKLNPDWLRGQPLGLWFADRADRPIFGPLLALPATALAFSYAGLLIDLSVGFLLLHRRTFPIAAALCVTFNLLNAYLFDIGIFPWLMIASLVLFPDPAWPRRLLHRLLRRPAPAGALSVPRLPSRREATSFAFLHVYLLIQLLLPLRHWLYPGDVAWNEAGHRFSWRMKLRDKDVGELLVEATDPTTGERTPIDLGAWLTPRQIEEMATRPDMLVDFAHHLAARWERAYGFRPIVTAKIVVSLNGGPYRDLHDPALDLASQPRGLLHPPW